jgi:hypothetical protein
MDQAKRTALLSLLNAQFDENELRDLCFDLNISYENLGGQGKSANARALIEYAERHGGTDDLVACCRVLRPKAPWPASVLDPDAPHLPPIALPLDHVPAVAHLPSGSLMPFAPNPLFVGREPNLLALARALHVGGAAAIAPLAAVTGLGGIGKTQLATEFAHRYGQYFAGGVFWLSFADAAGVSAAVAQCGGTAGMALRPDFANLPLAEQVALVRQEWQSRLPRLLIFDNCEDEALLANWRPTSGGCRMLITSRRATWDASFGVQTHALNTLPRDESIALLRALRPDLPADAVDMDASWAICRWRCT